MLIAKVATVANTVVLAVLLKYKLGFSVLEVESVSSVSLLITLCWF